MAEMTWLRHDEDVRLDTGHLMALYDDLGEAAADGVVGRAMDELAVRVAEMAAQRATADPGDFCRNARGLGRIAGQIGMSSFARVAQDVAECALAGDAVALAATWARLQRIADRSLVAVWDMQDISG